MSIKFDGLNSQREVVNPQEQIDKNYEKFLKEMPFILDNPESKQAFKDVFIRFNQLTSPIATKINTQEILQNSPNSQIDKQERINFLASQIVKTVAQNLGYSPHAKPKINLIPIDAQQIEVRLQFFVKHIENSLNNGKSFSEIDSEINSFYNANISTTELEKVHNEFVKTIPKTSLQLIKQNPKFPLLLSTLSDATLQQLGQELIHQPNPENLEKLEYIFTSLPSPKLTILSSTLLSKGDLAEVKNLWNKINSTYSTQLSDKQDQVTAFLTKNKLYASKIQQFQLGPQNIGGNRFLQGGIYIWSLLTFLTNSLLAVGIQMGKNPNEEGASGKSFAQALGLAALGASGMLVSGKAIMTNQSMLDVTKDYINKATNALTLDKKDVDSMDTQLCQKTILSTLDSSGLYLPALFSDDAFIDRLSNTNNLLDGKQKLTPELAHQKLADFYHSLLAKDLQSAEFLKQHFYNPDLKANNINSAEKRLTYLYAFQKMYSKAGITSRNSFLRAVGKSDGYFATLDKFQSVNL